LNPQDKITLLRLIESLGAPSSAHLHALFFRHLKPARAWNPATQAHHTPDQTGTRIESARRRLSSLQRRGEIEHFTYGRQGADGGRGCRSAALFLTPLAYYAYGSRLLLPAAPEPSNGLALRGWQRGELWSAFAKLGASCAAGWKDAPGEEPRTPYDVITHRGLQAILLVDAPGMSCEEMVRSIPAPAPSMGKQNVMVVPGLDGSVWDLDAKIWRAQGTRLRETLYLLGQRHDCALWSPARVASVGLLAVRRPRQTTTDDAAFSAA
jgi:hypothetical protein